MTTYRTPQPPANPKKDVFHRLQETLLPPRPTAVYRPTPTGRPNERITPKK